jgi:hypothetical protein
VAKVTIETKELMLAKAVCSARQIDEANVVAAIVALVDAYDAAHDYKEYSIREHLREALKQ